ncbi:TetR family transcriptional regulator [Actinomadura fulvescens]|uniref:TetR/AcrR family transcriptional regulator n=1 Tax=Actinomadura fulvescens TaxID=46160 RepID=A0ABN3PX18_9ACTN
MLTQADQEQTGPIRAKRPKRDREATRRRLLEAARDLFGEHGYDHVSVRMIAAAAGSNVALVNRYFGSKASLFGEVLAGESVLEKVVQGDPAGLPRRLAEHVVRQVHRGPSSPVPRMLDRSIGNPEILPILQQHLETMLVAPLTEQLTGPGARARATLAATIIMGGGPVRRLLGLDDLRTADPAELTERLTVMFDAALSPGVRESK